MTDRAIRLSQKKRTDSRPSLFADSDVFKIDAQKISRNSLSINMKHIDPTSLYIWGIIWWIIMKYFLAKISTIKYSYSYWKYSFIKNKFCRQNRSRQIIGEWVSFHFLLSFDDLFLLLRSRGIKIVWTRSRRLRADVSAERKKRFSRYNTANSEAGA